MDTVKLWKLQHSWIACTMSGLIIERSWFLTSSFDTHTAVDLQYNKGVIISNDKGNPALTAWHTLFHCRETEETEAAACLGKIWLASRVRDILIQQILSCIKQPNSIHALHWPGRICIPVSSTIFYFLFISFLFLRIVAYRMVLSSAHEPKPSQDEYTVLNWCSLIYQR